MVGSDDGRNCTRCGTALDGAEVCVGCGARPHVIELKVLPRNLAGGAATEPPSVRLVRQLKMPTVEHLVTGPAERVDGLPQAMRSMEDAVAEGDLATANQLLDEALGTVLVGPGHREEPTRWVVLAVVIWVSGGLVALWLAVRWLA